MTEFPLPAIDPLDLRTFPPVPPLSSIPGNWRQTFLAKRTECPRSAYLYLKYNGGALTHPLAGGTLLHRAIEQVVKHMVISEEPRIDPEQAKDILNDVMAESHDLTVSAQRMDELRSMMFHVAEGLLIDPTKVLCIETPVSIEVDGRTITGTIDFAEVEETRVTVLDWKSAFYYAAMRPPGEDEEDAGDDYMPTKEEWVASFQLVLYAVMLLLGKIDGADVDFNHIQEVVLKQVHPRIFWESEGTMAYHEAVIGRDALVDWMLYLKALVEQTEKSFKTWEWPAIQGSHCDYCPSSAECPIPPVVRSFRGEVRTQEDARRAAELWEAAGRRRTELWEAIKGFAKATGQPVRYGKDLELRWKTVHSEKIKDKVAVPGSKKKIKGRLALRENLQRAVEWGHQLIWSDYFTPSVSTRLTRRKLTPQELLAEEEAAQEEAHK